MLLHCLRPASQLMWQICLPLWWDLEGWPLASILFGFSACSVFSSCLTCLLFFHLSIYFCLSLFSPLLVWKLPVFSGFSEAVFLKCPCAGAPFHRAARAPLSSALSAGLSHCCSSLCTHVCCGHSFLLLHCHFSCKTTCLLLEVHSLEFPVVFENVYISLLFLKDTSAWCGILDEHLFSQHIKGCPCFLVFYCWWEVRCLSSRSLLLCNLSFLVFFWDLFFVHLRNLSI